MDKSYKKANDNEDKRGDEVDTSIVVLRKPRYVYEASNSGSVDSTDGVGKGGGDDNKTHKHVKWSESTELRERLKVYRRSQMDIPLDYHHLAIEEKREREGVQVWRNHLNSEGEDDDDDSHVDESEKEVAPVAAGGKDVGVVAATEVSGGYEDNSHNYDSDDTDPNLDEDLERNLQMIKEATTRYTLYPAYSAAISEYKDWLSNPEHTKQLTDDQITTKRLQLNLYKRLVGIYKEWTQQRSSAIPRESRFGEITSILQEASNLGQPPSSVSKVIRDVLTDKENVQKQVDAYNSQVQEMISVLDISNKV
uniref:Peroxin-19 n=1 Tax=Arion vulgaris TaxID=1028688 RepID=A0A0B7A419_9EUPU